MQEIVESTLADSLATGNDTAREPSSAPLTTPAPQAFPEGSQLVPSENYCLPDRDLRRRRFIHLADSTLSHEEISLAMSNRFPLRVPAADRAKLEAWIRARKTPQRLVLRSRVILKLGEGLSARGAARALGISRHTVDLWRRRYEQFGCAGLERDKPGRGRRPSGQGHQE
jgi:hypothetical protein